jgi:hypothetical protein
MYAKSVPLRKKEMLAVFRAGLCSNTLIIAKNRQVDGQTMAVDRAHY